MSQSVPQLTQSHRKVSVIYRKFGVTLRRRKRAVKTSRRPRSPREILRAGIRVAFRFRSASRTGARSDVRADVRPAIRADVRADVRAECVSTAG